MTEIKDLFMKTMAGQSTVLLSENVKLLNNRSVQIYSKASVGLNEEEVEDLRQIIMICNVLYNRTDLTILPIEDGFYDLLLELYKKYDSHFQVGSAIVDIQNIIENDIASPVKIVKPAISIMKDTVDGEKDELHQSFYNDLNKVYGLKREDFARNAISFINDNISKRTHNTQHNHPDLVGSLDKTKFVFNQDAINAGAFNDPNVAILERDFFQDHIRKGIINPYTRYGMVCELKYDGISVEADCGLEVFSARTRGDTGIGAASDITPILEGYTFKRAVPMIGEKPIGVKFEAIITKSDLARFNVARGRNYSNCRTAIIGLFGAGDAYLYRDYITLVPLAVDRDDVPQISNRLEEIQFMNTLFVSHGEPLRYVYIEGTVAELLYQIKAFQQEALALRDRLNFAYDGIVVSYVDENIRKRLGRVNYINKYSAAVKFDPEEKQTTFRGYTYEVGQNGNITPMIHYDTVEFNGTLHDKSTGSSLARFNELALKEGDYITVKYVNDVMPYVSRLECEHNRNNPNPVIEIIDHCPACRSKLIVSDSGKSLICPNMECPGRSKQRMVNMLQKMNIKGFADASINLINISHLYELENLTEEFLIERVGNADGKAFYQVIQSLKNDVWNDYVIMGSLGFTSIARKKWQSILQQITLKDLYELYRSSDTDEKFYARLISTINNIGDVTARTICSEFHFFERDILFILRRMHIVDSINSGSDDTIQIRFSGCRNQQLVQQLSIKGIDIDEGSVTKKTSILIVPYTGFTSTKTVKAEKYGTKIVAMSDFIEHMKEYIGCDLD